jgi:hypothetical protein
MADLFSILYEIVRTNQPKPGNQGRSCHLHVTPVEQMIGGGRMIVNGRADGHPESQGTVLFRLDTEQGGSPPGTPVY